MSNIVRAFWGGLALLTLLWLAAAPKVFEAPGFFAFRSFMLQYSGILAMGAMSIAMILALRPRWPERWCGGLDKMYRLHKWLGIGALVLAVAHWLWSEAPKWAVRLGLLERPERGPRPEIVDPVQSFLSGFRGPAEGLGEWAFYATVVLTALALFTRLPYHLFHKTHRLLPVAYLVLVFHSVVLANFDYWRTPLGLALAVLLAGGTYGACVSLLGRVGAGRRVRGTIREMRTYPGVRSLATTIDLDPGWPGHKPGQFAFAMSDRREGAHPYTIASAWNPAEPRLVFVTKELGDHTTGLADKLGVGQEVEIEGPYGCFTFDDDLPHQIWVGGGIGITPFIARMKHLAETPDAGSRRAIDLFHSTAEVDEAALNRLTEDASAANIRLHVLIDARDGYLTGERIREKVPGWRDASIWFCGPSGFGDALRRDFAAQGMAVEKRFHQELFSMR